MIFLVRGRVLGFRGRANAILELHRFDVTRVDEDRAGPERANLPDAKGSRE